MITAAESVLDVNDGCCTANVVPELNRTHPKAILTGLIQLSCPHEQYKWHIYEAILLSNHFNIIMDNNQIKIRLETSLVQRFFDIVLCKISKTLLCSIQMHFKQINTKVIYLKHNCSF